MKTKNELLKDLEKFLEDNPCPKYLRIILEMFLDKIEEGISVYTLQLSNNLQKFFDFEDPMLMSNILNDIGVNCSSISEQGGKLTFTLGKEEED